MVACTLLGQEMGRPLPKPGANTLGRGCPQIKVGVEPLGQGPTDCSGLAGKVTAPVPTPPAVVGATQAAQRHGVCYPELLTVNLILTLQFGTTQTTATSLSRYLLVQSRRQV